MSPIPAKDAVPSATAGRTRTTGPDGRHPKPSPTAEINSTWTTSMTRTIVSFAAISLGRPSGVEPSRFNTLYWRSNPVPIPRLTMEVDITASARIPGARKSTEEPFPPGLGSTSTSEKNTSSISGIPMLTSSCSPWRALSMSSART